MTVQASNTEQKRLRILGDDEIAALYERPRFTDEERMEYFSLSPAEKTMVEQFHSIPSRRYGILQLGYFKARHLFFAFELQEAIEDARSIQQLSFPDFQLTEFAMTKVTRLRHQRLIREHFHYRSCHARERQQLEHKALQSARVDSKPLYIFRELMHSLAAQRIVSPAYSVMQDTVGKALSDEQRRLTTSLRDHLEPAEIDALTLL